MPVIAPGIRSQSALDDWLDFSGTITAGNTAQLVLPQQPGRMVLFIENTSAADTLYIGQRSDGRQWRDWVHDPADCAFPRRLGSG
jgi:hypothetical protein